MVGANTALVELSLGGVFSNPNAAINAEGPSSVDFRHQIGVQGTYQIPIWGTAVMLGQARQLGWVPAAAVAPR